MTFNFTNGENNDGICGNGSRSVGASGSCQLLERGRDFHGLGVDEGEEEDVGALGLPVEQLGGPRLALALEALLVVIGEQDVQTQDLKDIRVIFPPDGEFCG